MKDQSSAPAKIEPANLSQWLSIPDAVILLVGPNSTRKQASLQDLRNQFPKAVYVRAKGPDAAFPLEVDQPLIIEDFQKLSRKTRKFIFSLNIPLILCTSRPLYWELWRAKKKIVRVFPR